MRELLQFKIHKLTKGGLIINRINDLSINKTENNFEILVLTKGLMDAYWLTLLDIQYINVEHDDDYFYLNYPNSIIE